MDATEKHNEFVKEFYDVIAAFLEKNPDLFVTGIHINYQEYATKRKVLTGLEATIEVQPASR
jgi:ABC-type glycerol-3-phosphate transport system substrate-binding protein